MSVCSVSGIVSDLDFGVGRIEQAELDSGRVFGEQREVDPDAVPRRAQRIREPGQTRKLFFGTDELHYHWNRDCFDRRGRPQCLR